MVIYERNHKHLTAVDGIEASQLECSCLACIRTLFSIKFILSDFILVYV